MRRFALLALCSLLFAAPNIIRFRNAASTAGLNFVLDNHPTPEKHMIETMPGGVAAFDYDADGLTDIFFTNGAAIPSMRKESAKFWNRLYRNEGKLRFRDVTSEAGVAGEGYSMGAAVADYDGDGRPDLFVAGVHHNLLYRNAGGKFEDVTARSAIKSDRWSVAAGWFDYDNDGRLDLFLVNYAKWTPKWDRFCGDQAKGIRVYCHPKYFEGLSNQLFRNKGDGTFEDVTERSGIGAHIGRGMSVAFADYDDDGWTDAFVTNDNLPNFLFRNKGDGTFEEVALLAGVALLDNGKPVASMGADFRDYDNDGKPDIILTALFGETFPLFRNAGKGEFRDATHASKVAGPTSQRSGWSVGFFDFDNDGYKDLFTANSHVNDRVELFEPTEYKNPNSLLRNKGDGTFESAEVFSAKCAHRGSGFADFNQDGRIDIAVSCLGAPAELWVNETPGQNNWLIIRPNRIGAKVKVGDQHNHMTTAVGYASSSDFGVHFGLGSQTTVDVEIRWPNGRTQTLEKVKANQVLSVSSP